MNVAQYRGVNFLFPHHLMALHYSKPPLSVSDQATLLLNRGLLCNNIQKLEEYLTTIGYYRLSAYWLPFELPSNNFTRNHQFRPNTDFDEILKLYFFDRRLRLLVIEAIERIEVALRSQWSGHLALESQNSHAYIDSSQFKCPSHHIRNLAKIDHDLERSKETFVQHYKSKYSTPHLPPIWAIVETMTLGSLSMWYENTESTKVKSAVSRMFGLPGHDITSKVLHALTPVRNVCAHHCRLWNRKFPMLLPKIKRLNHSLVTQANQQQDHYLYNYLVVIIHLMNSISPNSSWRQRLIDELNTVTPVQHQAMGFPGNWASLQIWT